MCHKTHITVTGVPVTRSLAGHCAMLPFTPIRYRAVPAAGSDVADDARPPRRGNVTGAIELTNRLMAPGSAGAPRSIAEPSCTAAGEGHGMRREEPTYEGCQVPAYEG